MSNLCRLLSLLLLLAFAAAAEVRTGPIRVAYLGKDTPERLCEQRCATLMRELGREAIWFDYLAEEND
ncbi:MAG: hypothetical protein U0984_15270, partial [Prosthecobacter sp.]|nr:hypothetical protein [Prosthecobacter sp.]